MIRYTIEDISNMLLKGVFFSETSFGAFYTNNLPFLTDFYGLNILHSLETPKSYQSLANYNLPNFSSIEHANRYTGAYVASTSVDSLHSTVVARGLFSKGQVSALLANTKGKKTHFHYFTKVSLATFHSLSYLDIDSFKLRYSKHLLYLSSDGLETRVYVKDVFCLYAQDYLSSGYSTTLMYNLGYDFLSDFGLFNILCRSIYTSTPYSPDLLKVFDMNMFESCILFLLSTSLPNTHTYVIFAMFKALHTKTVDKFFPNVLHEMFVSKLLFDMHLSGSSSLIVGQYAGVIKGSHDIYLEIYRPRSKASKYRCHKHFLSSMGTPNRAYMISILKMVCGRPLYLK